MNAEPRVSVRGGAALLRGLTLFLQGAQQERRRAASAAASAAPAAAGAAAGAARPRAASRRRRMAAAAAGGARDAAAAEAARRGGPRVFERLRKDTGFTRNEVDALYKIYKKLVTFNKGICKSHAGQSVVSVIGNAVTATEGIDRIVFREVLHNTFDIITENMLMDRIFCVWDRQNSGLITLENWFHGMALFLKGSTPKQIDYCFSVYDLNSDGYITKEEMFQLLRNCLIKFPQEEDPEESVKDLVDIVMRKMDKDKDGKVSLQDYQDSVAEEPLLLEAFGKCLPSESSKVTFLTTIKI